jgi:Tfp pilus assembly protein FimT
MSLFDKHHPSIRAFTLVEMLVVIGIIVAMMAFAVPAITSLAGSRTMTANVDALSDLLDFARTEAQARSTYVWVGFANLPTTDSANSSGNHQVAAAAFWSTDGTPTAADGALKPLSKLVRLDGTRIVRGSQAGGDLSPEMQKILPTSENPTPLATASTGKNLPDFSNIRFVQTLTFTPQGEVLLVAEPSPTAQVNQIIDIGLKRMRGDNPDAFNPDDGAIWLYGTTGRTRTWRL